MTPHRWSDVAIAALMVTALIAAGVAVVAVVQATSENSPVQLVLETPTATPSGPTAVPWADLRAEPTPAPVVQLRSLAPSPTPDIADLAVRPCRADDLAAGIGEVDGGTNSNTVLFLTFADIGADPCRLQGFPSVVVLAADGSEISNSGAGGTCGDSGCPVGVLTPGRKQPANKFELQQGDARLELIWANAKYGKPTASQCNAASAYLRFRLPEAGGDLSIPVVDFGCSLLDVGPFWVDPVPPPPPPPPSTFAVHLVAPATAIAGTTLKYYVVLTNLSLEEVTFVQGHCPNYVQTLTLTSPPGPDPHALNCGGVRSFMPGQSIAFAMELPLNPNQTMPLLYDLTWSWYGTYSGSDRTSVEILPAPTPSP